MFSLQKLNIIAEKKVTLAAIESEVIVSVQHVAINNIVLDCLNMNWVTSWIVNSLPLAIGLANWRNVIGGPTACRCYNIFSERDWNKRSQRIIVIHCRR